MDYINFEFKMKLKIVFVFYSYMLIIFIQNNGIYHSQLLHLINKGIH